MSSSKKSNKFNLFGALLCLLILGILSVIVIIETSSNKKNSNEENLRNSENFSNNEAALKNETSSNNETISNKTGLNNETIFHNGTFWQNETKESGACKEVKTEPNFDLRRYISAPWYVHQQAINSYSPPTDFFCVTARYTLIPNETSLGYTVAVDNKAQNSTGEEKSTQICAYTPQENEPAKFKVAPCYLPTSFAGDYWVVVFNDEEGYALVSGGQPMIPSGKGCRSSQGINQSGLWIFSRSPNRNETLVNKVREIAEDKGFDLGVLFDVDQKGCFGGRRSLRSI